MQKLSEVPDRKSGDACVKKEPSRQKKEILSLSTVTDEVTTIKIFLAAGRRPNASVFRQHTG